MKKILILVAVLGFAACSSKEKNDKQEMVAQNTEASEAQANDEAKAAYEEAQKEAEAAAQTAAEEAQAENTDTGSEEFGPYEGTEKSKLTCTSGDDVRTVTILEGNAGGCGVVYNKMGADKTIAVAENNMEFCPEVQNKVRGNLEAASFTCE